MVGTVANAGTLNFESTGNTTAGNITNYNSTNGTINLDNGLTVANNISKQTINLNSGTLLFTAGHADVLTDVALVGAEGTVIDLRTNAIEHQNLGDITLNGDMKIRLDADLGLDLDGQGTHTAAIDTITGNVISAVEGKKIYVDAVKILYDASDAPVEFKFAQGTVKDFIDIYADYKETEITGPADNYLVSYENKTDGGYLGFDYAGLASAIQSTKDQKIFTMHGDDKAKKDLGVLNGTKIQVIGNNNAVNGLYDNGDGTYTHLKGTVIGAGKTMEIENVGSVNASGDVVKSWNNFTNNVTDSNGVINNAGTLKVTDSVFSNNSAVNGGVIYNTGTLTLDGTNYFINNSATAATGAVSGGAVVNSGTGNITTIEDTTFKGNTVIATGTNVGAGGAINNISGATIGDINANFVNNSVTAGHGYGGAIQNDGGTIGDISGTFTGNSVTATWNAFGGAIYNVDSSIDDISADFTGNSATGSDVRGSAIYNGLYYTNSSVIGNISGNFTGNTATADSLIAGSVLTNVEATIGNISGNFTNNTATATGGYVYGALYNVSDTYIGRIGNITGNFTGNTSTAYRVYGGAIVNGGVINKIDGSTIANNISTATNLVAGGAIYNTGTFTEGIVNATFSGNQALSDYVARGGAIYNNSATPLTITDTQFTNNYAISPVSGGVQGGAIYNDTVSN